MNMIEQKKATIRASSTRKQLGTGGPTHTYSLTSDVAMHLPVDPELEKVEFLLNAEKDTTLEVELWDTGRRENYVPSTKQLAQSIAVRKGNEQWVTVKLPWHPDYPQNAFIIIKKNEQISLPMSDQPTTGILTYKKGKKPLVNQNEAPDRQPEQPVVRWSMRPFVRQTFLVNVYPETNAFSADKITDGYHRPYGAPHLWISNPLQNGKEEWVELNWDTPTRIREVQLIFNDDVNEDLINLHHHKTPFDIIPELVKEYRIEVESEGDWIVIHEEKENRKRKQQHYFRDNVVSSQLRVVVVSTNGALSAEIVAVRVY